jgi:hypothetical protein
MLQLVVDSDTQGITPSCVDCWPRILTVHKETNLLATASEVASAIGNIEIICNDVARAREFLARSSIGYHFRKGDLRPEATNLIEICRYTVRIISVCL